MEIQDVGLPGWTIQLPGGMVLKMGSAQGVLLIPDSEWTPTAEDVQAAIDNANEIKRLQGLLDFANATIEDMKEELYGDSEEEQPDPAVIEGVAAAAQARKADMQAAIDEANASVTTDLRP